MTSADRVVLGIPWYWILCLAIAALSVICGIITCICMDKRMKKKMLEYLSEHEELNSVNDEPISVARSGVSLQENKSQVKRIPTETKSATTNEIGKKPSKRRDSLTHVFTPKVKHPERMAMKRDENIEMVDGDAHAHRGQSSPISAEIQIYSKPITKPSNDCTGENVQMSVHETQTTLNKSLPTEVHLDKSTFDDVKSQNNLNRKVLLGNYVAPDIHADITRGSDYNPVSKYNGPKYVHSVGELTPRGSGRFSTLPDITTTTVIDETTRSALRKEAGGVMNAATMKTVMNSSDDRRSSTNSDISKKSLTSLHDAVVDTMPEVSTEPTIVCQAVSKYSSSEKHLPTQAVKAFECPLWNLQLGDTLLEESESVVDFSDRGVSESEDEPNVTGSVVCEDVDPPRSRIGAGRIETVEEVDKIVHL